MQVNGYQHYEGKKHTQEKQDIEIEQYQSILIIAMINVKSLFLSSLVADCLLLGESCEK